MPRAYRPARINRRGISWKRIRRARGGGSALGRRVRAINNNSVCYPRGLNKSELKVYDIYDVDLELSDTGTVKTNMFMPGQGDDMDDREGMETFMRSIQLEINIMPRASATLVSTYHIALVYDMQVNGAAPAYNNIWDGSGTQTQNDLYLSNAEFRTMSYRGRFVVIKEWRGTLTPLTNATYSATSPSWKHISYFKKLPCLKSIWSDTTGSVANLRSGGLWLTYRGSHDTTEASCPILNVNSRVRFEG